ncbi:MAG: protein translocase subunit SecF [Alphaproteobacteria bacterium]|nr:MAG: protein translocase subunit SecF [Alphaproteobacteria bacterium]
MRLLKLVPDNTNIDFMRWRNIALILSIVVTAASIALVFTRGLNWGVDFAGGQSLRVAFVSPPPIAQLRDQIERLDVGSATIQETRQNEAQHAATDSGRANLSEYLVRLPPPPGGDAASATAAGRVRAMIERDYPGNATIRSVDTVSPKVSGELLRSGAWAIGLAMLGIAIYIWLRFEWQFGVGALVTLFHDVWMTLGFFSLTRLEFDLNVVAAILTIVGYSLNDTVVIYDRIREDLRKYRKMAIVPLINTSLNETLSRTMVTSVSILLALLALLLLGPDVIFGLTIAIFIGIFVGTYSSIYISSPILVWLRVNTASFLPKDPVSRADRGPRNESIDGARV